MSFSLSFYFILTASKSAAAAVTPAVARKAEKKAEYEKKKAAAATDGEKSTVDKGKTEAKKSSPKTITSSTSSDAFITDPTAVKTAGTQASMKNDNGGSNKAAIQRAVEKSTSRLLKALHVFRRYTDYTGCKLPDEVELFGMALLGQTTVSSFEERLAQSVRTASLYLDVSTKHLSGLCVFLVFCFFVFLFFFAFFFLYCLRCILCFRNGVLSQFAFLLLNDLIYKSFRCS